MSKQEDRRRRFLILAVIIVAAVTLIAVNRLDLFAGKTSENQQTRILMDTVVDIRVEARQSEKLVEETFSLMQEQEQILSRFVATSEVTKINERSGEWVKVSPLTLELIELGIEMGRISRGAFDITVGAVLDAWGFGADHYRVPGEQELQAALQTVDYTQVEVNRDRGEVRIPEGVVLDLGGIAKGYIVDQGIKHLREAKAVRTIVNAGGDIGVIGKRADGQPWRVGVQDPKNPSEIRWVLPLADNSVVTSGDYQRYFTFEGKKYHHILDPKTGYPASGLRSVTIVGGNTTICDALSTAVFILGWDQGRELVEELDGVEGILVSDTEVWISPGLKELVVTQ